MHEINTDAVHGWLHGSPDAPTAFVLAHGAGGNAQAPLLRALTTALSDAGFAALRINLPYRRKRPSGSPRPAEAATDREGILAAVAMMRDGGAQRVVIGGHSYGGRQSSMLAAERPEAVNGLLLTSYPLHPPGKPSQMRTSHFPNILSPALFVHGTKDPFGACEDVIRSIGAIPGGAKLIPVDGAGHDLKAKRNGSYDSVVASILQGLGHLGL